MHEDHLIEPSKGYGILEGHVKILFITKNVRAMDETNVVLDMIGTKDEDYVYIGIAKQPWKAPFTSKED